MGRCLTRAENFNAAAQIERERRRLGSGDTLLVQGAEICNQKSGSLLQDTAAETQSELNNAGITTQTRTVQPCFILLTEKNDLSKSTNLCISCTSLPKRWL